MKRMKIISLLAMSAASCVFASDDWREVSLDSCRKVPGLAESMMGLCLEGKTLYAIGGGTLYALDVSEPANPTVLGSLDGMDNNRQVVSQNGFVYVVSRETGLRIVDARDPRNLKLRSRYDSVEFATGIDVVGTTAFLSERINGVEVVDVSDPDNPKHVCIRKTGESQSNRYRDGYLYSGEWGGGAVTVFDAHDLKSTTPRTGICARCLIPLARGGVLTSFRLPTLRIRNGSRALTFPCSSRATKISGPFAWRTAAHSAATATTAF